MAAFARQINILRVPSEGRFWEECYMLRIRSFVQTSVIKQEIYRNFRIGKRYMLLRPCLYMQFFFIILTINCASSTIIHVYTLI